MKVIMRRDGCMKSLDVCEKCLARFLQDTNKTIPLCFQGVEEDHSPNLTLEMHVGDKCVTVTMNEDARHEVALEGWTKFVDFWYVLRSSERPLRYVPQIHRNQRRFSE